MVRRTEAAAVVMGKYIVVGLWEIKWVSEVL